MYMAEARASGPAGLRDPFAWREALTPPSGVSPACSARSSHAGSFTARSGRSAANTPTSATPPSSPHNHNLSARSGFSNLSARSGCSNTSSRQIHVENVEKLVINNICVGECGDRLTRAAKVLEQFTEQAKKKPSGAQNRKAREARKLAESRISVSGGADKDVRAVNEGFYRLDGSNMGRNVFKKVARVADDVNFIYYWEDKDDPDSRGWWMGSAVGGDMVTAFNTSTSFECPTYGWRVPFDGDVDPTIKLEHLPSQGGLASVRSRNASSAPPVPAPAPAPADDDDHHNKAQKKTARKTRAKAAAAKVQTPTKEIQPRSNLETSPVPDDDHMLMMTRPLSESLFAYDDEVSEAAEPPQDVAEEDEPDIDDPQSHAYYGVSCCVEEEDAEVERQRKRKRKRVIEEDQEDEDERLKDEQRKAQEREMGERRRSEEEKAILCKRLQMMLKEQREAKRQQETMEDHNKHLKNENRQREHELHEEKRKQETMERANKQLEDDNKRLEQELLGAKRQQGTMEDENKQLTAENKQLTKKFQVTARRSIVESLKNYCKGEIPF